MKSKWENGRYFFQSYVANKLGNAKRSEWIDITNKLTLPELERAVIDNHLTVYEALNLAYLLGQKVK